MRSNTPIMLLLLMTAIVSPQITLAYCIGADPFMPDYDPHYYTASNEIARSQYLILGRVTSETWLGEDGKPKPLTPPFLSGGPRPRGFDPYSGTLYEVQVLHVFKGDPGTQITLFSDNSTARFEPEIGCEYLFFVEEEDFDDPIGRRFTIDICGNSTTADKSKQVLEDLFGPQDIK